ncbi:hypothetical protein NLI96_g11716 [Meripilus lineatus]|uniref:Uncharacterized protein n=1 Tax=Meripilus lineatus TaxID=2056292 RepID=A0AAD5Y8W2_9APHY|nr:hypothetical protein NLI96_g11716 [Physisporinus lineatus]
MTSMAAFNTPDDPDYHPLPLSQKHLTEEQVLALNGDPCMMIRPRRSLTEQTSEANYQLFCDGGFLNSQTSDSQIFGPLHDIPEEVHEHQEEDRKPEGNLLSEWESGAVTEDTLRELSLARAEIIRNREEIQQLRAQVAQGLKHCAARDSTIQELERRLESRCVHDTPPTAKVEKSPACRTCARTTARKSKAAMKK